MHLNKKKIYNFPIDKIKKNKKETDLTSRDFLGKVAIWASYYRLFPHIFVKEYLGITLKPFQSFLIFMMMVSNYFTFIASRGLGKTFLTAIYAIVRGVLFPGSLIVIASATKTQAMEMFLKIESIYHSSINFRRECSRPPSKSDNMPRVTFKNGSVIRVVASSDNARGGRCHVLILDESGRMDSKMIASVLRKFKASPRQPRFLSKDKYKTRSDLIEPNQEISLSSATMKVEDLWLTVQSHINNMADNKPYFACSIPYQMAIKEGLLLESQVREEMESPEFNEIIWGMEMDGLFYGNTTGGFYSLEDFLKSRVIEQPVYPKWSYDLIEGNNFKYPKPIEGEVRLLSIDVALSTSSSSDNAVLTMVRLVPKGNKYERLYSNMITIHGANTDDLTLLIKRTFHDLDCDYAILDAQTIGLAIYDRLAVTIEDKDRGTYYEGWKTVHTEGALAERDHDPDAKPIIYGIQANDRLNTTIAWNFKYHIKSGLAKFPVDRHKGREHLRSIKDFDKLSPENQAMFESQYGQFNSLIIEMVNLSYKINQSRGTLTFETTGENRKDRYSSASYADYVADILEKDLKSSDGDWEDYMLFN